jgi:nitroreductase
VDAYLAIASKRDERAYADTPIPDDVVTRILDCGRLSGSSQNTQKWEFVVVSGAAQESLSELVHVPHNVRTASLVVAIVGEAFPFDAGRCAQQMMLGAWNEGVVSCPNGTRDREAAAKLLGGEVKMILSFGYPARQHDAGKRTAEEWSAKANRKSLDELVRRV